jgi:hypothetical protein
LDIFVSLDFILILLLFDFIKSDTEVEVKVLLFLDFIKSDTEVEVSILLSLGFTKSDTEVEVSTFLFLLFILLKYNVSVFYEMANAKKVKVTII